MSKRSTFGQKRVSEAREAAHTILINSETEDAFTSSLLSTFSKESSLSERNRHLAEKIVRGVLETESSLDEELASLVKGSFKDLPIETKTSLRMGLYQIRHLDKIPESAAVNESVQLVKNTLGEGQSKLVNGVLRSAIRNGFKAYKSPDPATRIAQETSHSLEMVKRWLSDFGENDTEAFCKVNNTEWPLTVRASEHIITLYDLEKRFDDEGVEYEKTKYAKSALHIKKLPESIKLHELSSFKDGLFIIQDEASQLIVEIADLKNATLVIDLCAAPGGKSMHLASLIDKSAKVLAVDKNEKRMARVEENAQRLNISNVESIVGDARNFTHSEKADFVLLDAPCSGHGVIGRKKEIRKQNRNLEELSNLQVELLNHAATLVKPGGQLLYSTCSIELLENEGVISRFLELNSAFSIVRTTTKFDELITKEGFLRSWPHKHGMAGGFGCLLMNNG